MLKFFKNLFGSGPAGNHANGNGYATPYAPAVEQSNPVGVQAAYEAPPTPAAPAPAAQQWGQGGTNGVQVPLHAIIAVLPLELKTRIKQTMVAGMHVTLPLGHVLAQLAGGSVKITFGELRAAAPNVFSPQTDRDTVQIALPLNEILPQINPQFLPRRPTQKQVQVPEEVRGPFGGDNFGVTFSDTKTITAAQGAGASASPRAPSAPAAPVPPTRPAAPAPVPPANLKPPIAPKPPIPPPNLKPAGPGPGIPVRGAFGSPQAQPQSPAALTPRPVPPTPARPAPPTPAQTPPPGPAASPAIPFRGSFASTPTPPPPTATPSAFPPVRPAFPAARGAGATDLPAAVPRIPAPGLNGNGHASPPPSAPAQVVPAGPDACVDAPLAALSESWPEVVRNEIAQLNLTGTQLALPMRVIDPALRQGKVAFTWKVLRSWIRPAVPPTVSAHDGMLLDLPLHVIAPLFITKKKETSFFQKQKVDVDETIPNLFFGFPQGETEESIAEAPAEPAPISEAAAAPVAPQSPAAPVAPGAGVADEIPDVIFSPAPKLKPAGIPDTNFYVWGDSADSPRVDETEFKRKPVGGTEFMSRFATPNEVVSRAAALEGVAGALVALPDGLMVASKLSPDLNGDTLAAFLPHIFGKVSQCTKELRMGELNNLNFTVGNVPWKIFRVNAIFFAAFGRAGQPLPTAQLSALAGELDRKKQ